MNFFPMVVAATLCCLLVACNHSPQVTSSNATEYGGSNATDVAEPKGKVVNLNELEVPSETEFNDSKGKPFTTADLTSESPSKDRPLPADILKNYDDFQLLTDEPYVVSANSPSPYLCRVPLPYERADHGPHGYRWIRVLMNDPAATTLKEREENRSKRYPVGSIIIKEKLASADSTTPDAGIGGMIKRQAGYNPKHGDWEYFYQDPDGKLWTGKISNCISCHADTKDSDYVFGSWK